MDTNAGLNLYDKLPLHGLRLIKCIYGDWQDDLELRFEVFQKDQVPPYIALSYEWGDVTDKVRARLNLCPFKVTRNLHGALRLLRAAEACTSNHALRPHLSGLGQYWIWVDAICINQSDPYDKAAQIPRMGEIYRQAKRVICWLGSDIGLHTPAMYAFQYTFQNANRLHAWEQVSGNSSTDDEWIASFENLVDNRDLLAAGIIQIMRKSWFSRVWTVQEAVLATEEPIIVLGGLIAPARALSICMVMLMLQRSDQRLINATHNHSGLNIIDMMRHEQKRSLRSDLERSLTAFARRLYQAIHHTASSHVCSVPHDMIYGLLGIADSPSDLPDFLKPNYTTKFSEVYREYTKFLIEATGELVLLQKSVGVFSDQPSWVADFRYQRSLFLTRATEVSPSPFIKFTHDGRRLELKGQALGTVLKAHLNPYDLDKAPTKSMIDGFEDVLRETCSFNKRSLAELVVEVLLSFFENQLRLGPSILQQAYDILRGTNLFEATAGSGTPPEEAVTKVEKRIRGELGNPWLATDAGLIVQLSQAVSIQAGDVHCQFQTFNSEILLRPVREGYLLLTASAHTMKVRQSATMYHSAAPLQHFVIV